MGYTHYWNHGDLKSEKFSDVVVECHKVCGSLGILLRGPLGLGRPEYGKERLAFNGNEPTGDAYETFEICREATEFAFCKTAQKPYDLAVMCCLIVFRHFFGADFEVSSDGRDKDWKPARDACYKCLGYGVDFTLDRENSA
jgi:hypothetical protein